MDEQFLKIQKQFEEHFSQIDATALIVLKGHLLIEESLNSILKKFVFHSEFLENANLRFAQKIDVARSMSLGDHNNEMWELVISINSLRNELAHSLKSEKRVKKTQRVRELYLKLLDNAEMREQHKKESDDVVLLWSISFFLGFLTAFQAEVDRFRSLVDTMDQAMNAHKHSKNAG